MLTHDQLLEILSYDKDTGKFSWRKILNNRMWMGPNHVDRRGYQTIGINRKRYKAHRLAWFYVTGAWPNDEIDHINGIKTDNRFNNLRSVSRWQNAKNRNISTNNTSGAKGVSIRSDGRYRARIMVDKVSIHIGDFNSLDEASAAYMVASRKYFGEYTRESAG